MLANLIAMCLVILILALIGVAPIYAVHLNRQQSDDEL